MTNITTGARRCETYAGMFIHTASGLYLTLNRAYDPYSGRWLSRDPAGEDGGINLYGYVDQDPINQLDRFGLGPWTPPPGGISPPDSIPGGPWTPATGQRPGDFWGPKQPGSGRPMCRYVPPAGQGGPPGSQGYWKTQSPGQKGWQRYDNNGNPITPDQAHPGNPAPPDPTPATPTPAEPAPAEPTPIPEVPLEF